MPAILPFALILAVQCPDGSPPPCTRATVAAAAGANSVGVMLFNNVTRDTTYAYLSDGLSTEIATSLAKVPRLEVRSPGAVRSAQRGVEPDPRSIGRRLNVRYVVEGDYQRGGDRIRVTVRLVAVPSGTQRWSESYTRPAADLLTVQEEIARSVATAIAGQLLPAERTVLAARPTRNAEAYDHVLRGNFHLARRTPPGTGRAIDEYTAALRLDPAFALAAARVALAHALFIEWGWEYAGISRDSHMVRGLRAAERALALDSMSGDAWMARGYMASFENPRTLTGVLEGLERATVLDPRNAEAWHQYSSWLSGVGRHEQALAAASRALALEPGRAISHLQRGQTLEFMHRDVEALRSYDSAVVSDPEFYASYAGRGVVRLRLGDSAGARADADAALRLGPRGEEYYGLTVQAMVAAHTGDTATAIRHLDRALAAFPQGPVHTFVAQTIGFGLVAAGQTSRALDLLERAEPKGAILWWNLQFPAFDRIRGEPRFQRLERENRPPQAR